MLTKEQILLCGEKLLAKLPPGGTTIEFQSREQLEYFNFRRFLENLKIRSDRNNDSIIAMCGPRNSSKSCNSLVAALCLNHMGQEFDFEKNLFYGIEPVQDVLLQTTNTRRQVYDFDEGIKTSFKKRSLNAAVTLFEEVMTQARKKNHIYFLNIPKFTTLTGLMRNDLVHFWIEVIEKSENMEHDRGYARVALMARDDNPIAEDPWGITDLQKSYRRRWRRAAITAPHQKEQFMRKILSFVCVMRIPRLPKIVEDAYESRSQAALTEYGKRIHAGEAGLPAIRRRRLDENEEDDETPV